METIVIVLTVVETTTSTWTSTVLSTKFYFFSPDVVNSVLLIHS